MVQISIPYGWEPRNYQTYLWNALIKEGYKRAAYIWHRRAGKDLFGLNYLIREAIVNTAGTYWHVFPTYKQGRKAIWNETDLKGRKYLDYIPKDLITRINNQEMTIELENGSIYQIVGSDRVDELRGAGIKGVIFSEYSEQRPTAWATIRPMIMASNGWAIFNFTPKGQNHAYNLYNMAKDDPTWYTEIVTVDDTMGQVYSKESLEQAKKEDLAEGKTLDFINQEYYCSFYNAIEGAYYSAQLKEAEDSKRISDIPWEKDIMVDTWWDLGLRDETAIWFTQTVGREIRVIDYIEGTGKGMNEYIKMVREKPYIYGSHNAPHDIRVKEYSDGKSRYDKAYDMGIEFDVVPNIPVQDGINAVRSVFNKCYFDKTKCQKGLMALRNYKRKYNEIRECFDEKPYHDWASNGADAFRYFAVGLDEKRHQTQQNYQEYADNVINF
jgi:hypothetical protein